MWSRIKRRSAARSTESPYPAGPGARWATRWSANKEGSITCPSEAGDGKQAGREGRGRHTNEIAAGRRQLSAPNMYADLACPARGSGRTPCARCPAAQSRCTVPPGCPGRSAAGQGAAGRRTGAGREQQGAGRSAGLALKGQRHAWKHARQGRSGRAKQVQAALCGRACTAAAAPPPQTDPRRVGHGGVVHWEGGVAGVGGEQVAYKSRFAKPRLAHQQDLHVPAGEACECVCGVHG